MLILKAIKMKFIGLKQTNEQENRCDRSMIAVDCAANKQRRQRMTKNIPEMIHEKKSELFGFMVSYSYLLKCTNKTVLSLQAKRSACKSFFKMVYKVDLEEKGIFTTFVWM